MITASDRERQERARRFLEHRGGARHFLPSFTREDYDRYQQLAHEGDPHSQVLVGWMAYSGQGTEKDEDRGLDWFRKAAALDSAAGAFYCGRHALRANNYEEALRFFHQAAEKQFGPALFWLGLMHVRGYGMPVNRAKGIEYLQHAAQAGHFFAKHQLARMMVRGELGFANIFAGLILLPYSVVTAVINGLSKGYSERFMG